MFVRLDDRIAILVLAAAALGSNALPAAAQPTNDPSPAGLLVTDLFGRTINAHGLILVDWEGYIANPAIKFYLLPPPDAALPAKAILTAKEPRLYFDLPSQAGPKGPRKEVVWQKREKLPVSISIFPDRDGQDEEHQLVIDFTDARGKEEHLKLPIRVIDQDRERREEFTITVDYSQDRTGFFKDKDKRATIEQAARDWAYFLGDMKLASVPAGAERTLIWGPDGFKKSTQVTNAKEYTGYLLYAYGIRNELLPDAPVSAWWKQMKRDPAARGVRSGGEPSPYGDFQVAGGKTRPIRRSGGLELEVQGNYNTKGWLVTLPDREWWRATIHGDEVADLYSIAHHEIGHALIFNPNNPRIKRGEVLKGDKVRAYLGSLPTVSQSDHLEGVVDPASLRGAFGNEYHGRVPRGRWVITKLDLLCAQAVGYDLRETSAFRPLALQTQELPKGKTAAPYKAQLQAQGGIPFYNWELAAGTLPDGLALNSFTGEIGGTPRRAGVAELTLRVRDYTEDGQVTRRLKIEIGGD
jgi:hypothetical protein